MSVDVDDVRRILAGQWIVYDGIMERDVTVSWLVAAAEAPDGEHWPVHASASTAFKTLCGKSQTGVHFPRSYIPEAQQCQDCAAFLRANGRLR